MDDSIALVRRWIGEAEALVVLTGAGISTDSGIPDYRGPQGAWTKNPEAEKMSNIRHYVGDPEIRKRAWATRRDSPAWSAEPNDGHRALVALEQAGNLHTLLTQNVDGLHQLAGSDPSRVVEIHGTMREVTCLDCDDRAPMEKALARVAAGDEDPACRSCGGILKSATISFGQGLVPEDLARAERAALETDLLIAIGTTLGVYPIANVVPIAKRSGARVAIVNGSPTEMDDLADVVIGGSITDVLTALVAPG